MVDVPDPSEDAVLRRLRTLLSQAHAEPGTDPAPAAPAAGPASAAPDAAAPDAPGLDAPGSGPLSAREREERALEAALREDAPDVVRHARAGLDAPGGQEPALRLTLLRHLAVAAALTGDAESLDRWIGERCALLRTLGRPHQAELEAQLGAALVREPDAFEATVLAGVVDDERTRLAAAGPVVDPTDTVLGEALLGLGVHRVHETDLDGALELVLECLAVLRRHREAGAVLPTGAWSGAHLVLARLHLWRGEHLEAEAAAVTVLALPAARAVRASALLVRAIAAHERARPKDALRFALEACAGMAEAGLRRGAASAAALVARVAGDADQQDAAVAAWQLAAVHAEKAEAPEASALSYWWGHQLVLAGRPEEAEPVLDRLVRRAAAGGQAVEQARALVDLGHALHDQDHSDRALLLWAEAGDLFEHHEEWEDAARVLLAAGALVNRARDEATRPRALALFERAVAAARRAAAQAGADEEADADVDVLPAALHAHGYLLCESGRPEGLTLLDEAIALVERMPAPWQAADYLDTRARALWALEEGTEAVSTALTSADRFVAIGDREAAAQAELFAACVVAEDGRPAEAATLFRLIGESTESDLVRLGALSGLRQCLEVLGDHTGAARVRDDLDAVRDRLGLRLD